MCLCSHLIHQRSREERERAATCWFLPRCPQQGPGLLPGAGNSIRVSMCIQMCPPGLHWQGPGARSWSWGGAEAVQCGCVFCAQLGGTGSAADEHYLSVDWQQMTSPCPRVWVGGLLLWAFLMGSVGCYRPAFSSWRWRVPAGSISVRGEDFFPHQQPRQPHRASVCVCSSFPGGSLFNKTKDY